jgi:hypothetical protein
MVNIVTYKRYLWLAYNGIQDVVNHFSISCTYKMIGTKCAQMDDTYFSVCLFLAHLHSTMILT